MNTEQREQAYLKQSGRTTLTARQQRRVSKKENELKRVADHDMPSRPGRLRRRFNKKDTKQIKQNAAFAAAEIRMRIRRSRGEK